MPQMSSLMWFLLFMFFSLVYVASIIKTYFSSPASISVKEKKTQLLASFNKINWKW